jgi:nucleoside-diphosphate-sugar epimerase
MRVVLTGATGFLGGAVLRRLLERGDEVLALGRPGIDIPPGVEGAAFDLADPRPPQGMRPGDVVIHCAALLSHAKEEREAFLRANTESVRVLAHAAREAGAALFQFISTVSALGPTGTAERPLREDFPFRPASLYGESKMLAEQALAGIAGLRVQILRPGVIYGPGANPHSSAARVFRFMRGAVFFRRGAGDNHFNVIARENLVDALLFLADRALATAAPPAGDPQALPPCPDTWMVRDEPCPSMRQMQDWIAAAYGRSPLVLPLPWLLLAGLGALGDRLRARGLSFPFSAEVARGFGTSGYYSDQGRLLTAGWRPPVAPEEAVKRTAAWYAAQPR